MPNYAARRDRLRKLFKQSQADAMMVTDFVNVTYLTGFKGDDSYLLLDAKGEVLITDPRYTEQLETECPDLALEVRMPGMSMIEAIKRLVGEHKVKRLAVESQSMSLALHKVITEKLPQLELVPLKGLVESLRMIKDKDEIDATRRAVAIAQKAFGVVRAMLRPNMTERQVANMLEFQMREDGAKGCSFTPIVGVGPRAALPHGRPSDVPIGDAPFVLIDWGCTEELYMSDLTRVLVTGKPPAKLEKVYKVVLEANEAAIEAIAPGKTCAEIDKVARDVITKAGFGKQFGHGLGHGLGMEIHEDPRFGVGSEAVLEAGMIMTVEPGIYFPGVLGVRIEDDVLVTKNGYEVLTSVPKQWEAAFV